MNRRVRIFVVLIAIALFVAAAILIWQNLDTSSGNINPSPTTSSSLTDAASTLSGQSELPANAVPAELVRTVDGDTIVVQINGESGQETVRLIGIDTPETKKPGTPVQCYGKEASAYTSRLLTGNKIWLESDITNRDQYGRLLRYVWVENGSSVVLANEQIVGLGFGTAVDYPPDTLYHGRLFAALESARSQQLGMWGACDLKSQGTVIPGAPELWTGGDLDCADFASHQDAQTFFEAMGGPDRDLHSLDNDGDGVACRRLP